MSGADLERLSRDARRVARRENRSVAIDDLCAKIEPLPVLNETYQLQIAIHEAGHALVAHALNVGNVKRVEIFDNAQNIATGVDAHGVIVMRYPTVPFQTRSEMLNRIAFHLAGAAAEDVCYGDRSTTASGTNNSDFAKATEIAVEMVTRWGLGKSPYYLPGSVNTSNQGELWRDHLLRSEVNEILQTEYARAREMLSGLKETLRTFATELARHKRLQGDQLERLWPGAMSSGQAAAKKC